MSLYVLCVLYVVCQLSRVTPAGSVFTNTSPELRVSALSGELLKEEIKKPSRLKLKTILPLLCAS